MKLNSPRCSLMTLPALPIARLPLQAVGLVIAFLVVATAARAQSATTPPPAPTSAATPSVNEKAPPAETGNTGSIAPAEERVGDEYEYEPQLQVGNATRDLFAWQRSGVIASPTPRPIPGAIAYRSYERYLKSFEYPIPEHLNSSVKSPSSK